MNSIIELRDVSILQGKLPVLQHVSLDMRPGELIYLIGKTGSGKSSLLKTLYAALPLTHGHGKVCDFDLRQLPPKRIPALRRQLGIVFQDFALLTDRTVGSNLSFVLRATDWTGRQRIEDRCREVLRQVGMEDKIDRFPYQLSAGEQQRVAIARALLNQPPLLIADEPTGNLDWDTTVGVMQLLRELNASLHTAMIMATHDERLIEKFPARIVRCANGTLYS